MNKQELIKYFDELPYVSITQMGKKSFIDLIEQLDEPEKVTIPQFVADWIEKCKNKEKSLLNALLYTPEKVNSWVGNSENQETFALAWIFGYEVEKKKLIKVRLKGTGQYLCKDDTGLHFQHGFKTDFTKEYLEKVNFGWVFDFPGIEIEEV